MIHKDFVSRHRINNSNLFLIIKSNTEDRNKCLRFTVLFHFPYYCKSLPIRISIMKQKKESTSPLKIWIRNLSNALETLCNCLIRGKISTEFLMFISLTRIVNGSWKWSIESTMSSSSHFQEVKPIFLLTRPAWTSRISIRAENWYHFVDFPVGDERNALSLLPSEASPF